MLPSQGQATLSTELALCPFLTKPLSARPIHQKPLSTAVLITVRRRGLITGKQAMQRHLVPCFSGVLGPV